MTRFEGGRWGDPRAAITAALRRRFRIFGSDFTFVVPLRASVLAVEFIIAAMVIIGVLLRPPPVYASCVPPCSDPPTRRVCVLSAITSTRVHRYAP